MFSRPSPVFRTALRAVLTTTLLTSPLLLQAQASRSGSTPPPEPSRFELYGGYGYFNPVNSDINNIKYQPINRGAVASATGYFNKYLGVQAEGSFFPNGPNDCVYSAQAGPVVRYPKGRFVPFAHALGGGAKVGGPAFQACSWGVGVTGGVGLDYILPAFGNHLAIRPIQADYEWSQVDYGPLVLPAGVAGGVGEINAYRLSAGLVLRLGQVTPPPPVQMGCTVQPANVFPGEPVTVTASSLNLNPKRQATYTWTATGGKVTGTGATVTVTTAGLSEGDYTVSGHVSEGRRPGEQASCTAGFRVHAFEPPTIACSANPSTVMAGESSTITADGRSPQNRPLTYSYTSTAGQVTGSTTTATLSTAGGTPGTITVTCNVVDDLGKTATASVPVTVSAPPTPVAPQAQSLCSMSFERDRKRPVRVDNEAKGCLDDVALTLNRESAAKLVIVGKFGAGENSTSAEERSLNVRQYLTDEKGIDPSRIELRTGDGSGRTVETTLLPAGASFAPGGTSSFDPTGVQRHGAAYGKPGAGGAQQRSRRAPQ